MKRKIKFVLKEVLEKVIEVEVDESMSNNDVSGLVNEKFDSDGFNLSILDFKGDYSVEICTNCERLEASMFLIVKDGELV